MFDRSVNLSIIEPFNFQRLQSIAIMKAVRDRESFMQARGIAN